MPGLDPGIHVRRQAHPWMAGSGPGHDESEGAAHTWIAGSGPGHDESFYASPSGGEGRSILSTNRILGVRTAGRTRGTGPRPPGGRIAPERRNHPIVRFPVGRPRERPDGIMAWRSGALALWRLIIQPAESAAIAVSRARGLFCLRSFAGAAPIRPVPVIVEGSIRRIASYISMDSGKQSIRGFFRPRAAIVNGS